MVSFDAADLAWPCRWVLTYQDKALALTPPELAAQVPDAAQAIASQYADNGSFGRHHAEEQN